MPAFCDPTSPERGSGHLRGNAVLLSEDSPEGDALHRAVQQSGLNVTLQRLAGLAGDPVLQPPAEGTLRTAVQAALHPGVELVLIAAAEFDHVSAACAAARQVAGHAATLACLLAPRGRAPRIEPRAIRGLLRESADDLILGLPSPATVLTRALTALRLRGARLETERRARQQGALREVLDLLLGRVETAEAVPVPVVTTPSGRTLSPAAQSGRSESLHDALRVIVHAVGWDRADLVFVDEDTGALTRAASSDPGATVGPPPSPLSSDTGERGLADPEVLAALRGGVPTLVEGARARALLFPSRNAKESTVLLLPLPRVAGAADGGAMLLLLSDDPVAQLDRSQGDFLKLCAQLLGLAVGEAPALSPAAPLSEGHRERTQRVALPQVLSERRREAVLQYREFFEASADGMMVLDARGEVHYFNRTAEQITGYAAAGLVQRSILELVPETQHRGLRRALQQAIDQASLLPFDLQVTSTSGEDLILSASTSAVLAEHGLAVLSFRDVTQQRLLEGELRKTKDFLERLIDSTVDGIIAADLLGNIMVFNQGAARITGYAPEEVIGKRKVWTLYPPGEAQRIMAAMRASDHGGPGRLSPLRRALIGKDGGEIPVSLTASIIYEGGQEAATVGIFSDLRERLSIEQRLEQTQQRLAQSERQAIIAELAGAAAHELNQPLTSVMGYAGLLRRKLSSEGTVLDFVDTIVREAERMAEIVRKIGRITRYETKPYVGEARIIDLERSTVPEPPPPDDLFVALSARKKDTP